MVKTIVGIEGMACGMCEAHVNEAVRNAFQVKKVKSSHAKKQTVIIAEKEIPEQELKNVVAKTCDYLLPGLSVFRRDRIHFFMAS